MISRFEQEPDAPRQHGRDEAAQQRPDRGGDRACGPDQGEDLRPHLAFEVAVDQRLHRREVERGAEAPDDGPEDDDGGQALREHHRERAHGIQDQPDHVGALATEEVADLAADQDEGGRRERLDRDRGLNAAHRRVEVPDDRRDRDVHERRVDDEYEHRHRQQDAQPRVGACLLRSGHRRHLSTPGGRRCVIFPALERPSRLSQALRVGAGALPRPGPRPRDRRGQRRLPRGDDDAARGHRRPRDLRRLPGQPRRPGGDRRRATCGRRSSASARAASRTRWRSRSTTSGGPTRRAAASRSATGARSTRRWSTPTGGSPTSSTASRT